MLLPHIFISTYHFDIFENCSAALERIGLLRDQTLVENVDFLFWFKQGGANYFIDIAVQCCHCLIIKKQLYRESTSQIFDSVFCFCSLDYISILNTICIECFFDIYMAIKDVTENQFSANISDTNRTLWFDSDSQYL